MELDALMPPAELIIENGIGHINKDNLLQEFDAIGQSIARLITAKCAVQSHHKILDVGVGLGRVARMFSGILAQSGGYVGIDTTRSSIEWCRSSYARYPNFSFIHADIFSTWYNPHATTRPEDYKFPVPGNFFDVVFSSSLYTHMLIEGVENYLTEMARVLKPGGYTINTYYLLEKSLGRERIGRPYRVAQCGRRIFPKPWLGWTRI